MGEGTSRAERDGRERSGMSVRGVLALCAVLVVLAIVGFLGVRDRLIDWMDEEAATGVCVYQMNPHAVPSNSRTGRRGGLPET